MNLLLLYESDRIAGDRFAVTGTRARHVRDVLRAATGDSVRVGLLEGPVGTGLIDRLDAVRDEVRLELDCAFESPRAPVRPAVDLLLAVPRPKVLKRVLVDVASFGIDRLVLMRSWRVDKSYLSSRVLEPTVYEPLLHQGLMQGRSTRSPRVTFEPLFRPFVEGRAAELFGESRRLVAHPSAKSAVTSLSLGVAERVAIAVGPEGGWRPDEIASFERAGFVPVSAGERTLRVEAACVALLAQVEVLRGRA